MQVVNTMNPTNPTNTMNTVDSADLAFPPTDLYRYSGISASRGLTWFDRDAGQGYIYPDWFENQSGVIRYPLLIKENLLSSRGAFSCHARVGVCVAIDKTANVALLSFRT